MVDKLLRKHAKNFATSERGEGKLEGIHYHDNGNIYVTDAHKLLAIYDSHKGETYTKHYKTGKKMVIDYPKVERLLDVDYSVSTTLNMRSLKDYIPLIKVASNIDVFGKLIVEDGLLYLRIQSIEDSFQLVLGDVVEYLNVDLNVMYFYHMLNFFKDTKVEEINFKFSSPMRPLSFTAENYEIIILPVRRY